jgi:TolA-binding protein
MAKYKTEAERNAAAEKQFLDVQKKFGGSDASDVANLYLARIEASRGDTAAARRRLQAFINDHPKHLLVGSARYSLYQLRIENGEAAKVASELDAELKKAENQALPPDVMLVLQAHAYDAQGAGDKSRETYQRIIREFPDSSYVIEAQRRVGTQQQPAA